MLPFLAAVSLLTATLLVAQNPTLTTQNGSIAGTLRDTDGSPAAGVRVGAVVVQVNAETTTEAALLSLTQTDNAGQYRLEKVPPGRYLVMAGAIDAPSYFPGVAIRSAATVVTVAPQAEVTGIDFKMAIPPALRFSGYVIREDMTASVQGGAIGGNQTPQTTPARVYLSGPGPESSALIAGDGSFELSNIRPGTYQVLVPLVTPFIGTQTRTFTLEDKDITGFRLVVPFQVRVAGAATVEGGGPQPRLELTLSNTTGPLTSTQTQSLGAGQANFAVATGEYRVSVSDLPAGYVLKSMVSGNTNLAVAPLRVTEAGVPPIKVVLCPLLHRGCTSADALPGMPLQACG